MTKVFKVFQEDTSPEPLYQEEVTQLIKNDMQHFAIYVNNKDMSEFFVEVKKK